MQTDLVKDVELDALVLAPYNPRIIKNAEFEKLKKSLEQERDMLRARPVIALPDGTVICGNMRVRAARDLGWPSIPVFYADLDERRAREWMLRDNNSFGEWQEDQLAEILYELREQGSDVDTLGFSDREFAELMELVGGNGEVNVRDRSPGAEQGESLRSKWQTEPGQLWLIQGKNNQVHKILCGDSTNQDHVARLFGSYAASLVATDPPYLTDYDGSQHASSFLKRTGKRNDFSRDDTWDTMLSPEQGVDFYVAFLEIALEHVSRRAPFYQWFAMMNYSLIEQSWDQVGLHRHQGIIWSKNQPSLGRSHYMWQHEPCMYGWPNGSQPEQDRRPPFSSSTIWQVDNAGYGEEHPTQKPVELFARPIRYHTKRDEIVYEPFLGSGTQVIAAEQEVRTCYAIEIDPVYVAVSLERVVNLGLTPKLA